MVPPLIKCAGIDTPSARACNGIYEFQGSAGGRPCYHQTGISSGNHIWFAEEAYHGPMWVITPKAGGVSGCPREVIATSRSLARWPWEADEWSVCSPTGAELVPCPGMRLSILNPVAELEVQHTNLELKTEVARYRCAGDINSRPAYKRIDREDGVEERLFWMESQRGPALPRMGRWMLVRLKEDGSGIDNLLAQSHADDGASWAALWPWCVEKGGWERATEKTFGLNLADAEMRVDKPMHVNLVSPSVSFSGMADAPYDVDGIFEGRGMTNGRVFYMQKLENALNASVSSLALWFAEDRGQWVITTQDKLGDSTQVLARIASRAWWPWEAHLTSSSSPALMGAAMLAAMPPWHEGAAMLSSLRASWEMSDQTGKFRVLKEMAVDLIHDKQVAISAGEGAQHPFIGEYCYAGILSSRPYFLQQRTDAKTRARYVLWYSEDSENWVITNDFRLLDATTVDARVDDSAWFPWEMVSCWQVADGQGDFVTDILLKVAISTAALPEKKTQSSKKKTTKLKTGSEASVTSGSELDT